MGHGKATTGVSHAKPVRACWLSCRKQVPSLLCRLGKGPTFYCCIEQAEDSFSSLGISKARGLGSSLGSGFKLLESRLVSAQVFTGLSRGLDKNKAQRARVDIDQGESLPVHWFKDNQHSDRVLQCKGYVRVMWTQSSLKTCLTAGKTEKRNFKQGRGGMVLKKKRAQPFSVCLLISFAWFVLDCIYQM